MNNTIAMKNSNQITIRIRGDVGTKRVQMKCTESYGNLVSSIMNLYELTSNSDFYLSRHPNGSEKLTVYKYEQSLSEIGVYNGVLLYLHLSPDIENKMTVKETSTAEPMDTSQKDDVKSKLLPDDESTQNGISSSYKPYKPTYKRSLSIRSNLFEDEVDRILSEKDGLIPRSRDPRVCHHGVKGQCINCAPLEPYNSSYLESHDPPIRHLSFHSYLRKLSGGADKGKFVVLEDLSLKIKPGCSEHAPWPKGICSKCQPGVVTLKRQDYRHVDNVQFQDLSIANNFISIWRKTLTQRIGYLYGKYEEHTGVPLGIKATVYAIYEPPQQCTRDSVELLEDSKEELIEELARWLDIRKVGWIFTDLERVENSSKVHYKRNMNTFFLSAEECIMSAKFQNQHPNLIKLGSGGKFGSKFVTLCMSGNQEEDVETRGYQLSNQCMALVRDDCLVPCLDSPELGYVRQSTNMQYVPDVYYKTNENGHQTTLVGRPLPMDFMLLDVPVSAPKLDQAQKGMRLMGNKNGSDFPVENREFAGEFQSHQALITYLCSQPSNQFMAAMSDFHLLVYLMITNLADVRPHLQELCRAIATQDPNRAYTWRDTNPSWRTIEEIVRLSAGTPSPGYMGGSKRPEFPSIAGTSNVEIPWQCNKCTIINSSGAICTMCGAPKSN